MHDPAATVDGPGDATLEYLRQTNERKKAFENYDVVARYAPEVLGDINPTAGKVAQLGADTYQICKGLMNNSWGSAIEYELTRAFGLIEIYRNIFSPKTKGVYNTYSRLFIDAIDQLNRMPAGTSPEEVSDYGKRYFNYEKAVHCNTFNRDIRSMTWGCCAIGNNVPGGMISTHYQNYNKSFAAVAFNGRKEGKQYFADVIKQNGTIIYKDYVSSYGKENKRAFINYYYHWFIFEGDANQEYVFQNP